jgi:futalosine hydrolase
MIKYALFIPTEMEAAAVFGNKAVHGNSITITGMGKANTAAITAAWLQSNKDVTPVLLGIAGAYQGTPLKVGDICQVRYDYFVDEAEFDGKSLHSNPEFCFPVVKDNRMECLTPFEGLTICDANTVSLIPGTDELAEIYHNKTGAWIESMEGAAFALACQKAGLPAIQIRAVSNYCGNKKNRRWNIKPAAKNLKSIIEKLFTSLPS